MLLAGIHIIIYKSRCLLWRALALCLLVLPLRLAAQEVDLAAWLSYLPDGRQLSMLSLPGAHDAATGEGVRCVPGFGVTQVLSLSEQWDCGVRAFDLRPAVADTALLICHGRLRTAISFSEALQVMVEKLEQHPTEFAVVLLREEIEAESNDDRLRWPSMVGQAIAALGERAATFHPAITVGEMRGKILFLTRNAYVGTSHGAQIKGWSHAPQGTQNAKLTSVADGSCVSLQVQDFYRPTNRERAAQKTTGVMRFFQLAAAAPETWTINFLSGYATTWLGCTPLATTSGYKRHATALHPLVVSHLEKTPLTARHPLGLVFFDFVGADTVRGGLWHWQPFETQGLRLLQLIVERNAPFLPAAPH